MSLLLVIRHSQIMFIFYLWQELRDKHCQLEVKCKIFHQIIIFPIGIFTVSSFTIVGKITSAKLLYFFWRCFKAFLQFQVHKLWKQHNTIWNQDWQIPILYFKVLYKTISTWNFQGFSVKRIVIFLLLILIVCLWVGLKEGFC